MAETQYSNALIAVMQEKIPELADATDEDSVKKVIKEIKTMAAERTPAYLGDHWVYRITVGVLGAAVILSAGAQYHIALSAVGNLNYQIPDGLIAIGSAAIGALAGLFAPTPSR